jgi:hypothetical protein
MNVRSSSILEESDGSSLERGDGKQDSPRKIPTQDNLL